LIFPSVYVIMDYITVLTSPSGSYGTLVHTQSSLPLLQLVSIILYISTQVDSINNMYPITIGLKNSIILNKLRNNQFLIVDIILETKDNVISIPKQALLDDNTVMISENNIVKIKPVKTGISDKNNIEIIDGLNIGERIIINNFDKLVQDQVIIEDSLKNISK
ncbi:MAG: hypothetical protein PHP52_14910, partial [Bacteroidales bacterium]|nr:hypothetical protein [Bacteroidales bacterium]